MTFPFNTRTHSFKHINLYLSQWIWIALGTIIILSTATRAQVNFTGIDMFWKLTDELGKDITPAEETWQALFDTPGYHYLVDVDRKEKRFRSFFPLVFMPSQKTALDSVLEGKDRIDLFFLEHYLEIKAKRDSLEGFKAALAQTDLTQQALPIVAEYLPDGLTKSHLPPKIALVFYAPDGTATKGLIIIDLLLAMKMDLKAFLAHEMHHHFVEKITRLQRPGRDNDDYNLIHAIAQLQLEGTADLIDKRELMETAETVSDSDSEYHRRYKQSYRSASADFAKIDQLIVEISQDATRMKGHAKQIRNMLPFAGHPHGAYMAKLIEDKLGKSAVIATLTNPFAFITTYNKAAGMDDGNSHVFSDTAIEFLKTLAQKYIE